MRIVLISCVKTKQDKPCKAVDMYISPLFRGMVSYAKKIGYHKLYILSAKYGLLKENDIISPYEATLKQKSEKEKKIWAINVLKALQRDGVDISKDEFIVLAGKEYRKYILQKIKNYRIPLEGMGLGKQLKYLKE